MPRNGEGRPEAALDNSRALTLARPHDEPMVPCERAALAYADAGLAVLPCNGKIPLTRRGSHDATLEHELIREWWREWPRANVAIATGSRSGSLFVVDLDGPDGVRSFAELVKGHGGIAATFTVRTSRGLHLYFRATPERRVANSAGRIAAGVDVRGEGGYVVTAPSVHETGHRYQVARHVAIAHAPTWLEKLADAGSWAASPVTAPAAAPALAAAGEITAYGAGALRRKCETVAAAAPGTRRDALNSASYALGQLVGEIDPAVAAAELEYAALRQSEPLGLVEIRKTIANGLRDGAARPFSPRRNT